MDWILGRVFYLSGLHREAKETFLEGHKAHPSDSRYLVGQGLAESALNQHAAALAAFSAALKVNPSDAEAYVGRGLEFLAVKEFVAARRAFRAATRTAPELQDGWLGLARVSMVEGNPREALAVLEAASYRKLRALVEVSYESRGSEVLAFLACLHLGEGAEDKARAAINRIAFRDVQPREYGNPLEDFLATLGHAMVLRAKQLLAEHTGALEAQQAKLAVGRAKACERRQALLPQPASRPFVPPATCRCRVCGASASYHTATGGGAGMVHFIFKCTKCGQFTASPK